MTTLAIDIGGTKLAAALIDDDLQIRERREQPTPASKTPDALRAALKSLVEPIMSAAQRVAIASTGIIREGTLLSINPHNLGGLLHFPLVQTLESITGLPAMAVNDAQAAAWAEYHAPGIDAPDMVFITVSTGSAVAWCSMVSCRRGRAGLPGIWGIRWPIRRDQFAAAVVQGVWKRLPPVGRLLPGRRASWRVSMRRRSSTMRSAVISPPASWSLIRPKRWRDSSPMSKQ